MRKNKDQMASSGPLSGPIEQRFRRLERKIKRIESQLRGDDFGLTEGGNSFLHSSYVMYGETEFKPEPFHPKRRPGAPHEISRSDFADRRDRMVNLVEGLWPELERVLAKPYQTHRDLRSALLQQYPEWKLGSSYKFLRRAGYPLWEYLQANKILHPRNLAYAMAGVPQLTWRSSLDRCGRKREPSTLPIHFRAMKEHIQDRHLKWYRLLIKEALTHRTQKMIPENCADCARFMKRPDRIMNAINIEPLPRNEWSPMIEPVVLEVVDSGEMEKGETDGEFLFNE